MKGQAKAAIKQLQNEPMLTCKCSSSHCGSCCSRNLFSFSKKTARGCTNKSSDNQQSCVKLCSTFLTSAAVSSKSSENANMLSISVRFCTRSLLAWTWTNSGPPLQTPLKKRNSARHADTLLSWLNVVPLTTWTLSWSRSCHTTGKNRLFSPRSSQSRLQFCPWWDNKRQ